MKPIVVIGSINMDLVCRMPRMPGAGAMIADGSLIPCRGLK
jgi:hypothetical protein